MIRKLTYKDKNEYCKLAMEFYNSDAVLHTIPAEYIEKTFTELMRSDEYVQCFILEAENKTAGYALLSKTFSQECGGYVIWIEELFILKQFRGMGLGSEFFSFIEKNIPAARYRLEAEPENKRAIRLYERRGFKPLTYTQMIKEID
ncbi:MAG: GNAT family N-acetyltransferase [Clostridiales bacterium]|nr:GNAT family N-acetyltransferase [Clostridiales bacterium]